MTARSCLRLLHMAGAGHFSRIQWAVADQATVSGANFLTIYLLARYMEVEEFGFFMIGWISLLFLVSLESAVITEPHAVLGPKRDLNRYRQLTTVLMVALVFGAAAVGLLLGLAGALTWGLGAQRYGQLLVLLGLVVLPWTAQEFVRRVLYTRSETRAAFVNDTVSYGLQAAGIGVVVALGRTPSAAVAFGVLGFSSLIAVGIGIGQIRDHLDAGSVTPVVGLAIWKEAAGFGKWLLARSIVTWAGLYGNAWLLLAMLGPVALGTYKAAEHLLSLVNPLRAAAYAYLAPRGSRVHAEQGTNALRRWVGGVYWSVGGTVVGSILTLMVLSSPLLRLAYGDKFTGLNLQWVIVLCGVAGILSFARIPLEMGIGATQQSRPLFWIHVWSLPLLLVTGTALIHLFGIFGLPVSNMVIGSVLLVLSVRAFRRVAAADGSQLPAPVARCRWRRSRGKEVLAGDSILREASL